MLKETRGLVAAAVKAGKTVQQMKAEHLMAKYQDLARLYQGGRLDETLMRM